MLALCPSGKQASHIARQAMCLHDPSKHDCKHQAFVSYCMIAYSGEHTLLVRAANSASSVVLVADSKF